MGIILGPLADKSEYTVTDTGTTARMFYWVDGDFVQATNDIDLPSIGAPFPGTDVQAGILLRSKRASALSGNPPQCEVECTFSTQPLSFGAGAGASASADAVIPVEGPGVRISSTTISDRRFTGEEVPTGFDVVIGKDGEGADVDVPGERLEIDHLITVSAFNSRKDQWRAARSTLNSTAFLGYDAYTLLYRGFELTYLPTEAGYALNVSHTWDWRPDRVAASGWDVVWVAVDNAGEESLSNPVRVYGEADFNAVFL